MADFSIEHLDARAGYDAWARIYDDENNPLIALEEPLVYAALGEVRGTDVLDLGCGTGRHTVALWRKGARVTGVDFSRGMLERARAKIAEERPTDGAPLPQFIEHDLAQRLPFADGAFDGVLCGLVLEHVADLDFVFREMRRVCRAEGRIVVSLLHPAMMLRGITARFTDPETGRETRPKSWPHQVSDFVMAAVRSGHEIVEISEHFADAELAKRSPRAEKYVGWPLLLMMVTRPG